MNGSEHGYCTYSIYENHKRNYLQWGPTQTSERPLWSDENGVPRTKEEINKLTEVNTGWEWLGDWTVDTSNKNLSKEGWEFASAWSKFGKRDARDWANAGDKVRRRKWIRTMKKDNPSSSSSKNAASQQASHDHMTKNIVRAIKILDGTNKDINGFVKRIGTEKDSLRDRHNFEEVFCTTEARLHEVEQELVHLKEDGGSKIHGTAYKLRKDLDRVKRDLQSSRERYDKKVRNHPLHSASEDFDNSYDSAKERPINAANSQNPASEQKQYSFTEHPHPQYPGERQSLDPESQRIDAQLQAIDEVEINEAIMREREEEISKINGDLLKVHEITQDLHNMVELQQEGIDTITRHVEQTRDRTEIGLKEVKQAEKSQKAGCILH